MALSFCDVGHVREAFYLLAKKLVEDFKDDEIHRNFIIYFEDTWIRIGHKALRFDLAMYHNKHITEFNLPRTN